MAMIRTIAVEPEIILIDGLASALDPVFTL